MSIDSVGGNPLFNLNPPGGGGPIISNTPASNVPPTWLVGLQDALGEILSTTPGQPVPPGSPTNANGAPVIEEPEIALTTDELALLLGSLSNLIGEDQLKNLKEGIKADLQKKQAQHAAAIQKLEEAFEMYEQQAEKEKANKILGWFGKVFAFVAAVVSVVVAAVATVASGGAAAPLLALAVMGLVASTVDLASAINVEMGGEPFGLGSLLMDGLTKMFQAFGLDEKEAAKAAGGLMIAAIALNPSMVMVAPDSLTEAFLAVGMDPKAAMIAGLVLTMAIQLTLGIVMAIATGGASVVGTVAQVATKIAQVTQAVAMVVNGSVNIAQGALAIQIAQIQAEIANLDADKLDIQKLLKALEASMEGQQEAIKDVLAMLEQSMQQIAAMIGDSAKSMNQQISAMAPQQTQA
jgi:transloator